MIHQLGGCTQRLVNPDMRILVKVFVVLLAVIAPVTSGVAGPAAQFEAWKGDVQQGMHNAVDTVKRGVDKINADLNTPEGKKITKEVEIGLIAGGSAAAATAAAAGIAYGVSHQKPPTTTATTTFTKFVTTVTTIDVNATIESEVQARVEAELEERDPRAMIFWLVVVLFVVIGIFICLCAYHSTKDQWKDLESSEDEFGEPVSQCLSSRELKDFKDPELNGDEEGIE
mmetsp:Transcript_87963/g.138873  ORF Transcript_87963/g.138873 Transcript_87963/m.138873 type:complete len:228 (+) Transcript_87963:39-722(+)|eukprot:CAMPEP_0169128900 /NCGR_PEP_ID=MMETSP1015-20121227/36830_1 /TAXON_ID=342587 /ORGANISM="Karlodinium micrum, Strain CCMP2283" /LENGTH=227 /DNA_ID=CAMNT_0009192865 /DNA_START=34 /DNA_END=717 /DNA_ORIENTATION=+